MEGAQLPGHERSLSKRVLKNSFFVLFARGMQLVSAFVVAVAVARYLPITEYGEYSFILAYVSSIMALAYFGIQQILIREIAQGAASAPQLLGAAVELRTILSVIAAAIIVVSFFFMELPRPFMIAALIAVASELCLSFSMLSKSVFQAFEKMVYEPMVSVAYSLALLVGTGAVIVLGMGFLWIFLALALANLVQLVVASVILSKRFVRPDFTLDRGIFRRFFKDALVIGVGVFFYQNLFKINVIMLRWLGSVTDVSYFSAPHNLIVQLQIVPLSLATAIFPVFSRLIWTERERMLAIYEKVFRFMLLGSFFVAVVLCVYSREIITLVFSHKFEQSGAVLAIIAWAVVPLTMDMLLNGILIAMNKQKYAVIYAGAAIVLNFTASVIFIPRYGYMAASFIAVASYTMLFLCSQYVIARNGIMIAIGRTVLRASVAAAVATGAFLLVKQYSVAVSVPAGSAAFLLVIMATGAVSAGELRTIMEALRTSRRVNPL